MYTVFFCINEIMKQFILFISKSIFISFKVKHVLLNYNLPQKKRKLIIKKSLEIDLTSLLFIPWV